ncbi:MAG: hypothetical protein EPN85_01850 [Bacteroidetes bacterium]|nr:MAG: hypothetical protein EPN85_01850 [Bacteroidota bacterium]
MDATVERNNRLIAMGITTLVAALLLIVILLIKFITPIPPFEESTQGGLEVNFGFDEAGMGDNNTMDPVTNDQKTKAEVNSRTENNPSEMISTEEVSNVAALPVKNTQPEIKVETPRQPDQNLLNVLNKVHSSLGSNPGDGNTNTPGNQGDPSGTLNSNVYSTGGGTGLDPKFRLKGSGRKMIRDVAIYDNSQETGIVAVEILVDKYGKIIKAEPVLMGSTTTSSILWKKAKDGLMSQVLFNQSASGEEARGTIYINFTVR